MSVVVPSLRPAIAVPGWAKNELWRKAKAVPSLDLRFADSKSLVDATTGQNLVTFSRASGGTYVDSQGVLRTALVNEPRFDHDPTTGESLGLLVEESRTNLLLRSEEFDNAYWTTGGGLVTPNATTAPDGTLTADLYTTTGDAQSIYPLTGTTVSPNTSYAFSVYVKLGTMAVGNYKLAFYDVTNTAFIAVDVVPAQVPTTDAWTRVEYTLTTPAGCTTLRAYPFRNSATIPSSTVHLWGAQLEPGSFPTSYIKNVDTPEGVTRAADVASISGSNFSSWYRQDEGTMYAQVVKASEIGSGRFPRLCSISDGTTSNSINGVRYGAGTFRPAITVGGVVQAAFDTAPTVAAGSAGRFAYAIKQDDIAGATNGGTVVTDTSATLPTVNQMHIGDIYTPLTTTTNNGAIARLTFWPQRLSNATLQTITL